MSPEETGDPRSVPQNMRTQTRQRPLRLAQLILTLRPGGGAETLVHTLAKGITERSVDLHVISLRKSDTSLAAAIIATGAQVNEQHGHKLLNLSRLWRLYRYLSKHKFDVIHTHLTGANILGLIMGTLLRVPVVVTLHNTRMQSQQHRLHGWLESQLMKFCADRIVAVGWLTATAHQQRVGAKEIKVIPNAVPEQKPEAPDDLATLRQELMHCPEKHCLLAVGRLNIQKGYPDLIAAMAQLRLSNPNFELLIAGFGGQRERILSEIQQHDLEQHVTLLGLRRDIPRLMQMADLFVSAAHWEGLPVAVLEAMASGLPMAITRVGDIHQVVPDNAAWLVNPQDPAELANAISSALNDPNGRERRARQAQIHVEANFGVTKWIDQLLEIYDELR